MIPWFQSPTKSVLVPLGLVLIVAGIIIPLPLTRLAGPLNESLSRSALALLRPPFSSWVCFLAGCSAVIVGCQIERHARRDHSVRIEPERANPVWFDRVSFLMFCIPVATFFIFIAGLLLLRLLNLTVPTWFEPFRDSLAPALWIACGTLGLTYGVRAYALARYIKSNSEQRRALVSIVLNAASLWILGTIGSLGNSSS